MEKKAKYLSKYKRKKQILCKTLSWGDDLGIKAWEGMVPFDSRRKVELVRCRGWDLEK